MLRNWECFQLAEGSERQVFKQRSELDRVVVPAVLNHLSARSIRITQLSACLHEQGLSPKTDSTVGPLCAQSRPKQQQTPGPFSPLTSTPCPDVTRTLAKSTSSLLTASSPALRARLTWGGPRQLHPCRDTSCPSSDLNHVLPPGPAPRL